MKNGPLWVFLVVAGMYGLNAQAARHGVDFRTAVVAACEWITGREAQYR
jgi:hypothetical protein